MFAGINLLSLETLLRLCKGHCQLVTPFLTVCSLCHLTCHQRVKRGQRSRCLGEHVCQQRPHKELSTVHQLLDPVTVSRRETQGPYLKDFLIGGTPTDEGLSPLVLSLCKHWLLDLVKCQYLPQYCSHY